jgi:iron complex outermembrane receptor protein
MSRRWYSAQYLFALLLTVPPVELSFAQTRLPEVTVTAPWERSPGGSLELGSASSIGSRLGLTLLEIPAAVEIIPGEVLRERGDLTAQEAVTRATGITAAGTPGDGSSALVSRGFAGHSSVMQLYDGTRLFVGAGTMTFPTDTWLFDRIEVLRGPASVLYGEGAIGGAINYIPRQPLRSERVTDVLLSGGSYDTYRVGLNTTGPLANRLAYQFGVIGTTSDGYVDNGDWQRLSLASSLLFDVTSDLKLTLAFDGSLNEPSRYWGTPLRGDSIDEAFRKRNYNVRDGVIRYQDYWIRLRADWQALPSLTVRNEAYALITDRHWRNLEEYEFLPATEQVFRSLYLEIFHDQEQYGNRLDARYTGTALGRKYRVLGGFDINRIKFRRTSNTPFGGDSIVDAFSPEPGEFINLAGTRPELETHTTQFSVFTEGMLQVFEPFKFIAGLRFDYFDYTRDDLINPANGFDKTFTPFTWRFGGVYDLTKGLAAYGQITRGVDPLGSLITLPLSQQNTKLASAMQYEIGLKSQFLGGRAEGTLAGYYITKENLLSRDPSNPTVTQQIGEQFAYGLEATLGLRLTSYLTIDANIAVLDAQFDDFTEVSGGVPVSRNGNRPPNVPELAANLWAVFSPTPAWRLGGGMRYVGERYADNANNVRVPDYTLFDAFVTFAPARLWSLSLRGRNLTDATYAIAPYTSTQLILGEPRVIELVANLRF